MTLDIDKVARTLVQAEYPRAQIEEEMLKRWDAAVATPAIDRAYDWKRGLDEDLATQAGADEAAAVNAEHDTDQTMHRKEV